MTDYLRRETPKARVYCIGEPPLLQKLHAAGLQLVADPRVEGEKVDVVVASFDRTFDYEKLDCALQAIRKGARFVATNADVTCPVDGGVIPDCGGIIAAIEAVSGKSVDIVVGKPNVLTAQAALNKLGLSPERCTMIGDRLETDILMGNKAGMQTILVLTGVSNRVDAERAEAAGGKPDYILDSVAQLVRAVSA